MHAVAKQAIPATLAPGVIPSTRLAIFMHLPPDWYNPKSTDAPLAGRIRILDAWRNPPARETQFSG
jgi:hypothetical protein